MLTTSVLVFLTLIKRHHARSTLDSVPWRLNLT